MLDMRWVRDQMNNAALNRVVRATQSENVVAKRNTRPRRSQFMTVVALGLVVGVTLIKSVVRG
jgi:hypothetical protein